MIREFIIPFKGVKKKTLYHFSDTHLTEYDDFSTDVEKADAVKRTEAWENVRKGYALGYGEPYAEEQQKTPKEHYVNLLEISGKGDALLMAGDILDYISPANLRLFDAEMSRFPKPYLTVCGNHEYPENIPEGHLLSKAKQPWQTLDLGDMTVIAFDDSKRTITKEQNEKLLEVLSFGKPVLILIHIPIKTEGNKERLEKAGEYFQLNYVNCPPENLEFIDIIKRNSDKIIAVLAGHLHFSDVSEIGNGVMQYVTSQGVVGNINRYIIGE